LIALLQLQAGAAKIFSSAYALSMVFGPRRERLTSVIVLDPE